MSTDPKHRLPPKPFNTAPQGLWRATPPAIFPVMLGFMALGLAWRNASFAMGAPAFIGEMILGAASLLYVFGVFTYLAKLVRRPAVLAEDLRILPGRAGLAAGTVGGMLLAASLAGFNEGLARSILVIALMCHMIVAALIIRSFIIGPSEQARVTPAWHLSFVGPIVGAMAAAPMGWTQLSVMIYATTLPIAAAIWLISLLLFFKSDVPPPMRPLLAIHLAPMALFTIVSMQLGYTNAGIAFGTLSITYLIVLLASIRYLTKSGFSALWGAFTFPLAAFANAMFTVSFTTHSPFATIGGIELVGATLAIVFILYKVMQLWTKGKLAKATNAASI